MATVECHICKNNFESIHPGRKYCSSECYTVASRRNAKKRYTSSGLFNKKMKYYAKFRRIIIHTSKMDNIPKGRDEKIKRFIGCYAKEARNHIESLFEPGFTWDNYGDVWVLDHKIPVSSFDFNSEDEIKKCYNYTNIQPISRIGNSVKGSKDVLRIAKVKGCNNDTVGRVYVPKEFIGHGIKIFRDDLGKVSAAIGKVKRNGPKQLIIMLSDGATDIKDGDYVTIEKFKGELVKEDDT